MYKVLARMQDPSVVLIRGNVIVYEGDIGRTRSQPGTIKYPRFMNNKLSVAVDIRHLASYKYAGNVQLESVV